MPKYQIARAQEFRKWIASMFVGESREVPLDIYPEGAETAYRECRKLNMKCAHIRVERMGKVVLVRTA